MSATAIFQPDYDFWEFASCGRCQLPFTTTSGATVPFWLTECGHIVCNTHLNANQSCSICGEPGIQLVPLQREMEAPMSEWFQSIPIGLDTIANAAKFQYETMASQIRHYRTRHQQQRVLIERLKHDVGELKKHNDHLNNENNQLHQQLGSSSTARHEALQPDLLNANGKRLRTEAQPYDYNLGLRASTSSPHSSLTPIGPDRLTLPQRQPASNLFSVPTEISDEPQSHVNHPPDISNTLESRLRPASGLVEKYAYVAPSTARTHAQQNAQDPLPTFLHSTTDQENYQTGQLRLQNRPYRNMPPPSTPSRFKEPSVQFPKQQPHRGRFQPASRTHAGQPQKSMTEPYLQTRREHQSGGIRASVTNKQDSSKHTSKHGVVNTATETNRFTQLSQHPAVPPTLGMTTSNDHARQQIPPLGSRAPSRAQNLHLSGAGQRAPFIPRQN